MAEGVDLHPQAERRRVDVAQQLERQRRIELERVLELLDRLFLVDLVDQLDDRLHAGRDLRLALRRRVGADRIVFSRGAVLMSQRFDPDALAVSGEAVPLPFGNVDLLCGDSGALFVRTRRRLLSL